MVIYDVVKEVEIWGVLVIVDGGICYFGDIMKVIVVGVNVVMIGGLFVGLVESFGMIIFY